ncbi:MAG TPA: Hsp33 family molecular chaperone HslO [Casimicrobiaceae bacterium]|nr:Hsp33 family molecular chaperone HslO [Casimicrobiaceae bacterium]
MTDSAARDAFSRFLFEGAGVRGARVLLDATARSIVASHPYPPALARVLRELAACATLLAGSLKFDGTLIVQLAGDGPVRLIVVECTTALALRATAQWDEARVRALPAGATLHDLAGGPASARLAITLDPRADGAMTQGIVALEAGSVAEVVEHYLSSSEQVASKLALAHNGDDVAGVLLQRLPGSSAHDEGTWRDAMAALDAADVLALGLAATSDPGLSALFPGHDLRVFRALPPRFECSCSVARVEGALRIAGRQEIEAALAEQGRVEVVCEFCGRQYLFAPAEARALFAPPPGAGSSTRH